MTQLKGQVALVVGGTKGIGRAIAKGLAEQGANVTIIGRSEDGQTIARALRGTFLQADVSLMNEVKRVAQTFLIHHDRLDILIHSADVLRFKRQETTEGLELSFATNYLSRFLLNALLLECLKESAPARIIHIAASGAPGRLDPDHIPPPPKLSSMQGHNVGQRANDLYGLELAERLKGTGISINILNPGMVDTGIRRNAPGFKTIARIMEFLMRHTTQSPEQYAELPISLATSPTLAKERGVLIGTKGNALKSDEPKYNASLRRTLWEQSERLLELDSNGVDLIASAVVETV
ncbi:MAG: SDR family NAD(P)-dependent oxidoreductase [Deinococcota bacterium]